MVKVNSLLPSRILLDIGIDIGVVAEQREPVMLGTEITGEYLFFTEFGNACIGGIFGSEEAFILYADKLLRSLLDIFRLGEEQPTLEVVEAESLEGKLDGTFATHLIHKLVAGILGGNAGHIKTGTTANDLNSLGSSQIKTRLGCLVATAPCGTSLCIHQIHVGKTEVRDVSVGIGTVIVGTVILLTGVRHKLLVEITGAGSVGHCTHRSACGESGIFHSLVFLRVTVDILHAVKHDVVVEARVATLKDG